MTRFLKRLARGFRREDGTASIEFVMAVPVLMTIFMASFNARCRMRPTNSRAAAGDIAPGVVLPGAEAASPVAGRAAEGSLGAMMLAEASSAVNNSRRISFFLFVANAE